MTRVLVVDDEAETVEFMRDWLKLRQYDVLTANNGTEAIQVAETQLPDLVLLDVVMPGIDGIETCKRLRQGKKTGHIPVILITGNDPSVGRAEGLMAGAADYITKPIVLNDLEERIKALLAESEVPLNHSERLIEETVHNALLILPCELAWLLTIDTPQKSLISRAVASSEGEEAAATFRAALEDTSFELQPDSTILAQVAIYNAAQFNIPLSQLRRKGTEKVFRACEKLGLYFLSIAPLQASGPVQGVLVLGLRDPLDVSEPRNQQLMTAIVSQAAMAVDNARLVHSLIERENESARERTFSQMLLDNMSDGLMAYDENGQIRFVNRRLCLMTGYDVETLKGRTVDELFHPNDQERLAETFLSVRQARTSSFEFRLMRADGSYLPVLAAQASTREGQDRVMVVTDLSEQKAREQELTKRSQHLAALLRASQAISSTLSLDEAIHTILNEVSVALDATIASVLLRMRRDNVLVFHSAVGPHAERLRGVRLPIDRGLASYVAREGEPLLVDDAYADPRFYKDIDAITGLKTRSVAAVPLTVQGDVVGVVEVVNKRTGSFNQEDLEILQGLARSAAIAIENARLFGEAQRRVRELTILLQAGEAASSTLATEQVLETVARMLLDALSVKWCVISSWSDDLLGKLAEVADVSWPPGRQRRLSLAQYPLTQKAIETGKPLATSLNEPDLEPARRDELLAMGLHATLLVPIIIDGQTAGLAELYHVSANHLFSVADLERCRAVLQAWRGTLSADRPWFDPISARQLSTKLLQATDTSWCTILTYNKDTGTLSAVLDMGQASWPLGERHGQPLDEESPCRVALVEKTAVVTRLGDPKLPPVDQHAFPRIDSGALLIVPLMARGQAVGVVQLIDLNPQRRFSESELSLAQAISNVIGNALENTRLYSALVRRAAQLEAAYNDLADADRTKEQLIQNVSHEMRTPLTALTGYMDLLLNEYLGPLTEEQRDALEVVNAKSLQLTQLVEDMLTLQEMEKGTLYRRHTSIVDVAERAIQAIQPLADRASIELLRDYAPDLPRVFIDSERMFQVFHHLLSNAIKFSPERGRVLVSMRDTGPSIQVEVADEGIGIPKEEQDKIWRRFYQVDGSTTRAYGGTGLGLTIVKQIVEGHEGRVWVTSEPGQGSTFSFTIPKTEMTRTGSLRPFTSTSGSTL